MKFIDEFLSPVLHEEFYIKWVAIGADQFSLVAYFSSVSKNLLLSSR